MMIGSLISVAIDSDVQRESLHELSNKTKSLYDVLMATQRQLAVVDSVRWAIRDSIYAEVMK